MNNDHLALMHFSWAMDLDPKGANSQIKDALDPTMNRPSQEEAGGAGGADGEDEAAGGGGGGGGSRAEGAGEAMVQGGTVQLLLACFAMYP